MATKDGNTYRHKRQAQNKRSGGTEQHTVVPKPYNRKKGKVRSWLERQVGKLTGTYSAGTFKELKDGTV